MAFPFTDLTSSKKRPALVISPDASNVLQQDVVLAAITSQTGGERHSVTLSIGDFAGGSLPKPSEVKLAKIFTIHSSLVIKKLCSVTEKKRNAVLFSIRQFFA